MLKTFCLHHPFGLTLRRLIWRLGRKLYCWARNELGDGPENNGEYNLLGFLLHNNRGPIVLVDIGANKGEWSSEALRRSDAIGKEVTIHTFEPSVDSFLYLQSLLKHPRVKLNNLAVSSVSGSSCLFVRGELCATNSLYNDGAWLEIEEEVSCETLDNYFTNHSVCRIDFVKSDTEGHDFHVMQGAAHLLSDGMIDIWQFEYNHRWIHARHYLRDVFLFIADKPYLLGRLSSSGIEVYEDWHPELERYFEANFVLLHKDYLGNPNISVTSLFGPCNVPVRK